MSLSFGDAALVGGINGLIIAIGYFSGSRRALWLSPRAGLAGESVDSIRNRSLPIRGLFSFVWHQMFRRPMHVVKTYQAGDNQINALRSISMEIDQGAYVSIVGPSGSGKSTLFQAIGGLELIEGGELWVNEQPIHQLKEAELARIRREQLSFIFQQFHLLPTATALENVMMPLISFASTKIIKAKAEEMLEKVGLKDRMHHLPSRLSGGEQQRVAIARAFVTNPQIILADEPTGNLDSENVQNVMTLLEDFHQQQGGTVMLITHDLDLAKRADRQIHLLDGAIVNDIFANTTL